jgi:hypothetical protein
VRVKTTAYKGITMDAIPVDSVRIIEMKITYATQATAVQKGLY